MSTEHANKVGAGSSRTLWKKGQSGNPSGRPPGAKDRRTVAMEEFINAGPEVALAVVRAAKAGDVAAAALVLARIAPPLKAHAPTVRFVFDVNRSLTEQAAQILEAVSVGAVDPETGCNLIQAITVYAKLREGDELMARLSQVEAVMRGELPMVQRVEPHRIELHQGFSDAASDAEADVGGPNRDVTEGTSPEPNGAPAAVQQPAEPAAVVTGASPKYPPPWQISENRHEDDR